MRMFCRQFPPFRRPPDRPPTARRKVSPKDRRKSERERYLTFTKSSVQARHEDERFKTRTITREDLEMTSSPEKNSPRSIKQRRSEDSARYLTHTITPADLRQERQEESLTVQEAALLESEARLVVKTTKKRMKVEAKTGHKLTSGPFRLMARKRFFHDQPSRPIARRIFL